MHVVFRESKGLDDTEAPFDPDQTPADLVFLSFSDTDLGAFMSGYKRAKGTLPSLRLANLVALKHPLSVDEYVEKTLAGAKGILIRLIGGEAYWSYGLSRVCALAKERNIALAILPADAIEDPRLDELSNLPKSTLDRLNHLCNIGGEVAAQAAIAQLALAAGLYASPVLGQKEVPDFGYYHPETGIASNFEPSDKMVLVVFYRSYMTAADHAPVDLIIQNVQARGYNPIGVFVPSLKNPAARAWLETELAHIRPVSILNTTVFSAQSDNAKGSPLDVADVPVLQVAFSTARKSEWQESDRGLSPQDLAMHVVLPEVDGRIFAGVGSFKAVLPRDKELQYSRFQNKGDDEQISRVLDLMEAWIRLRTLPNIDAKIMLVLSTYPGKSFQMAHAVGCDAIASCNEIMAMLSAQGYNAKTHDDLAASLKSSKHSLPLSEYANLLKALPQSLVDDLYEFWGEPQNDHKFREDAFHFEILNSSKVQVALQPERGFKIDRKELYHDLESVPCHSYVAFYLMLQKQVDALVHIGAHGTLEWLPGKSVALSKTCWPELLAGAMPIIYPFIVNDPGEAVMAKRRIHAITLGHMPPPIGNVETPQNLIELEGLLDEYSTADGLDPRRRDRLISQIRIHAQSNDIEQSLGIKEDASAAEAIAAIDSFLCDVKDSQFAEGLHIYGQGEHGKDELHGLQMALQGRRVDAGPAGSPYRGHSNVTPTGRNLFTTDPNALPTQTAHRQGVKLAEELVRKHLQDHGDYPKHLVLNIWGSATMRTAGEEIAMALHLAGVAPEWNPKTGRVAGFEILPLAILNRPRIGVVLRVSGLFRDVFPAIVKLFQSACDALSERVFDDHETAEMNPYGDDIPRVFSPRPQNYGIAIDEYPTEYSDVAKTAAGEAWLRASQWVMSKSGEMHEDRAGIETRVREAEGFVHVQDLVETDILMASDYASHQAGFASARHAIGEDATPNYHIDHTKAGEPKARGLSEEITRVVYARASNPAWISSMMQHAFRGGAEIAATLDHMAQFASLSSTVPAELFDLYFDATLGQDDVREFLVKNNPEALAAMQNRFYQLMEYGLWKSHKNSIRHDVMEMQK